MAPGGNVWFVSSLLGKDAAGGKQGMDPTYPFKSISYAISKCRNNKGDNIIAMPGHVELITSGTSFVINKAGIWILGTGIGRDRPQLKLQTANTATISITANRVRLSNLYISAIDFAAIANPITPNAADFSMQDCDIELANATNQAVLGVLTTALCNRLRILRCRFFGTVNAGNTSAVRLVGAADDVDIADSSFYGAYSGAVGAIENITVATTNVKIDNCRIDNRTAGSTKAISLLAGTTGFISNCRMQILSGTAPITGAGISWAGGNYYAAAVGTAGTLI